MKTLNAPTPSIPEPRRKYDYYIAKADELREFWRRCSASPQRRSRSLRFSNADTVITYRQAVIRRQQTDR